MIHYNECPSCGAREISEWLKVEDFSVSKESFLLMKCDHCGLVFTQDIPSAGEIARYYQAEQYISHSDTNRGLVNKLYHIVRQRTVRTKRTLVCRSTKLERGNILDIGSGTGSFLREMRSSGWEITGIEPDEIARENAIKINDIKSIAPAETEQLQGSSFDAITMWHVLEHVHHLKEQVHQIHRLLRDNGTAFIAVPNHSSYDARYYKQYWAAWDVPRHLYHFSPGSMRFLWEQNDFEVTTILPMWYDSFYVSMLSEKYRSGKTKVIHPFLIGMISNLHTMFHRDRCSSLIYVIQKRKTAW